MALGAAIAVLGLGAACGSGGDELDEDAVRRLAASRLTTTTTTEAPRTTVVERLAAPTTTSAPPTTTTTTTPPPPPPPPTTAAPRPVAPPPPPAPRAAAPPQPASGCDPNYTGCVPIDSDVDCAGGGGNGPSFVDGPVTVIGNDIYGLDGNNDNRIGCES